MDKSMEPRRVSIILVVYNGMQYLPDCLAAVMEECRANPGSELLILDNASSDGSAEWIAASYPSVILFRNPHNVGFAAASNQGAAAATGELLVFLNQDTRVFPGWLKPLVEALDGQADVGLVTSKLLYMRQPDQIQLCGQELHYTGLISGIGAQSRAETFTEQQQVGAVSGASFAIRRELWRLLGGFDEKYFMYYEESDLSWRASLRGFTSWVAPASVALHDAGLQPSVDARYYMLRNRPQLFLAHWKWLTLVLLLPGLLLVELAEWTIMLRLGPRYALLKLKASAWLVWHLPELLRNRHAVQATRKVSDASLLAQCAATLTPRGSTIGLPPGLLVRMVNTFLSFNYRLALSILKRLKV